MSSSKDKKILAIIGLANIFFFYIGVLGVGNDIYSYLFKRGRFGDFDVNTLFQVLKAIPNPSIPAQFPAFDILWVRVFEPHSLLLLTCSILAGVLLPWILTLRLLSLRLKRLGVLCACLILFGYPFIFAFFRGNPVIASALWCIFGVFSYLYGLKKTSIFSIILASLIHPASTPFLVIFLADSNKTFVKALFLAFLLQLACYFLIGRNLLLTLTNQFSSLEMYKTYYALMGWGDLYNNSLFIIFRLAMPLQKEFLTFLISFLPIFLIGFILFRFLNIKSMYGRNLATIFVGVYFVPVYVILASPVSADYKLMYLYIPIIFMLISKYYRYPFWILLGIIIPKHFIFFSSYWLINYPNSLLVFSNIRDIHSIGITVNSLINPILLLVVLFASFKEIGVLVHGLNQFKFLSKLNQSSF